MTARPSEEEKGSRDRQGGSRTLSRRALRRLRRVTSDGGSLERGARSARNVAKFTLGRAVVRRDLYVKGHGGGQRFGVFGTGACDVRAIVGAGPLLSRKHKGPMCVGSFGLVYENRSDILIQALDPPDPDLTADVRKRLGLSDHYFRPALFEPTFRIPDQVGTGSWPKNVVVLSLASDVARTVYTHKEHGFLVDPGGWWLASEMGDVIGDLTTAKWFGSTFSKGQRIALDESISNHERLITEIRARTGAFVVLMNVLTVDPGSTALDYKHANSPNRLRRREFKEAFAYLGQKMGFPVLDVDRLTKASGISGQADFVHYTSDQKRLISQEFARILFDAEVVGRAGSDRSVRTS